MDKLVYVWRQIGGKQTKIYRFYHEKKGDASCAWYTYLMGIMRKCMPNMGMSISAALAALRVDAMLLGPPAT